MERQQLPYRRNVGAIVRRFDDQILMCERLTPRDTWQFPQGGIDAGETREQALWRELTEELGFEDPRAILDVVAQGPETIYEFSPNYDAPITRKYRGQRQTLFLLDFRGTDEHFVLDRHDEPEFAAIQWVSVSNAMDLLWEFKRPVLEATLAALEGVFDAGFGR